MRVLGIDTATWRAGVAVCDGGRVVAERSLTVTASHAMSLLPMIGEVMDAAAVRLADLDLVAVSIGPGSFTGLRIGLSAAKGLCLAAGVPLVGVPTLEAIARALGPRGGLVCPVLDARKGEVYAALYRWCGEGIEEVEAAMAVRPADLAARLRGPCTLLGDGVDAYGPRWREGVGGERDLIASSSVPPTGSAVARLGASLAARRGADDLDALEPTYLRKSEAELKRAPDSC